MSVSYSSLCIIGVPIIESKQITQIQKFNEDTGASYMKDVEKTIYLIYGTQIEIDRDYIVDTVYNIGDIGCISVHGFTEQDFVGMLVSIVNDETCGAYEIIDDIENKKTKIVDYLKDKFGYTGGVNTILAMCAD